MKMAASEVLLSSVSAVYVSVSAFGRWDYRVYQLNYPVVIKPNEISVV